MDDGLDDTIGIGVRQPPSSPSEGSSAMPSTHSTRVPLGRTELDGHPAGVRRRVDRRTVHAGRRRRRAPTVERAWDLGIRYFDVGAALRLRDRRAADRAALRGPAAGRVRLVDQGRPAGPSARRDPRRRRRRPPGARWTARTRSTPTPPAGACLRLLRRRRPRSIEESLERLGLDRIDIAFIHDPDDHWEAAIGGAYPALHRLRDQGIVRAIGAGMNQSEMLARFAREADIDVVPRRRPLHDPRPGSARRAAAARASSAASRSSSAGS